MSGGRTPDRCSRCGARPAVYRRVYSGEFLCLDCLRRSVLRGIKRVISRYGLLREDSHILLVIPRWDVHRAAAELFELVEAAFPRVRLDLEDAPDVGGDYWSSLLAAAKLAASDAGGRVPVVPLTLDDALGFFLLFYSGRPLALAVDGRLSLGPAAAVEGTVALPTVEIPMAEIQVLFKVQRPEDPILSALDRMEAAAPGAKMNLLRTYHRLVAPRRREPFFK